MEYMGIESFQEEPAQEPIGPTQEEQKVQRDDSRARKVLAALGAALGISIANQAPITDLHQHQLSSPEYTQPANAKESPKPWRSDGTTVTFDLKQPVTNIDLRDQERVTNIDLHQKVVSMKPPEYAP